jgi:dienelactone hydrolase
MHIGMMVAPLAMVAAVELVQAADLVYSYGGQNYTFVDYTYLGVPGRLYVPPAYNTNTPTPLVMFLHGIGEQGSNNTSQVNDNIGNLMANAKARDFLLFAPQSAPNAWWAELDKTVLTLGKIATQYNVNPNKIYITGLSAGGQGTMYALSSYSDLFAGFVPLSISTDSGFKSSAAAAVAANSPTWYYVGYNDTTIMNDTRGSVTYTATAKGIPVAQQPVWPSGQVNYSYVSPDANLRYTQIASAGHDNGVWNNGAYNDPNMYSWLLGESNSMAPLAPGKTMRLSCRDWNTPVNLHGVADSKGQIWNMPTNLGTTEGVIQTFAHDSSGARTTFTIETPVGKAFYSSGTTTLPAGAPFDASVAGGYWRIYIWNHPTSQTVIHGLMPGAEYDMELFASIATASTTDYVGIYSVGGQSVTINARNNADLTYLRGLVADSAGNLALNMSIASGSSNAVLNTLSVTMVPEPTSMVCVLGVAGLAGLRRRHAAV